jgi:hypothetical protein
MYILLIRKRYWLSQLYRNYTYATFTLYNRFEDNRLFFCLFRFCQALYVKTILSKWELIQRFHRRYLNKPLKLPTSTTAVMLM